MDRYFCIVSLPTETVAEFCVLQAGNDEEARSEGRRIALDWPAEARLSLYCGERRVDILTGVLRKAA